MGRNISLERDIQSGGFDYDLLATIVYGSGCELLNVGRRRRYGQY
jgi:hypothetical protein